MYTAKYLCTDCSGEDPQEWWAIYDPEGTVIANVPEWCKESLLSHLNR